MKRLLLAVAIILIVSLLAGVAAVVLQPTLITGRYYEIDITSVEIGSWGWVEIKYNERITYDTEIVCERPPYGFRQGPSVDNWDNREPTFLRWPRRLENGALRAHIRTEEESGVKDLEMYRQRVLVKEGAYRIRAGESLPLYRYKGADGSLIEGRIVVRRRS